MERVITATNSGPIAHHQIKLPGYGVTILSAPNGSGKSILLDSLSKLVAGKGAVPLKDGEQSGEIEGFGGRITLGHNTRHFGTIDIKHLEGRFNLANLVDPKLKDPVASDKRRIKSLVAITGAKADPHLFQQHKAFVDFGQVVSKAAIDTNDLLEMADRIKRSYEAKARDAEDDSQRLFGSAKALFESTKDVDTTVETDQVTLNAAHADALKAMGALREREQMLSERIQKQETARRRMNDVINVYDGPTLVDAMNHEDECVEVLHNAANEVSDLEMKLEKARRDHVAAEKVVKDATANVARARSYEEVVAKCKEIIEDDADEQVSEEELEQAAENLDMAQLAIEEGVRARDALTAHDKQEEYRAEAAEAQNRAVNYREASKAVDEVLSQAIKCDRLKVSSVGGAARLVAPSHKRGPTTLYGELSDGEKWAIAIDLGADVVGRDGLIIIPQIAWESIDVFVRPGIHDHAKNREVYVVTAEATRDEEDGHNLLVKYGEEVLLA